MEHFLQAVRHTQPSLQKGCEGVVDSSPVFWDSIGGLDNVKVQIKQVHYTLLVSGMILHSTKMFCDCFLLNF